MVIATQVRFQFCASEASPCSLLANKDLLPNEDPAAQGRLAKGVQHHTGVVSEPAVQIDTVATSVEAGGQTVTLQPPQIVQHSRSSDVKADGPHAATDIFAPR